MRWLCLLLLLGACKRSTPQPAPDAAATAAATGAVPAARPPNPEPSANQEPLSDAAPPAPETDEARKMLAPVYDWVRACFKDHPATADEKPPFLVRMTAMPNGSISQVEVTGRPSATECVRDAVREKLKLRPWTGSAMEIHLPVTAAGDPVFIDAGSAAH